MKADMDKLADQVKADMDKLEELPREWIEAIDKLAPKMFMMYDTNPEMLNLESFVIAGRDDQGNVHVGVWQLTKEQMEALLKDCLTMPTTYLGGEPPHSH